ncbi:MAG: 16S rRNA (guanine(527)-N(7))-methyltransferase RsmG [Thermodesulfobacteriota bacterium]
MTVSRETKDWRTWPEALILERGAAELGLAVTDGQIGLLLTYLHLLRQWNTRIKLIGPAPASEQVVLHLLDSLSGLRMVTEDRLDVLDLGSGGGLPGLILKMVRPGWSMFLAEARKKKAAFIKQSIRRISLSGATVLPERIGADARPAGRPAFDLVVFRALGTLSESLPLARSLLSPTGRILAYKGPAAQKELLEAGPRLTDWGLLLAGEDKFRLPFLGHQRVLLLFASL